MLYILDDTDEVVECLDTIVWSQWFEQNRSRRIIGRTYIQLNPDIFVSTVFLATDHGLGRPQDKPVLWETLVFGMEGELEDECERYTSKEEAVKGHLKLVDEVREAWDNEKTKRWSKVNTISCPNCENPI